jgi:hypothetical protein
VLPDGRIDVDGQIFLSPSAAARSISGNNENGWWFFAIGPNTKESLGDLLEQYLNQTSEEIDETIDEGGADEDEDEADDEQ